MSDTGDNMSKNLKHESLIELVRAFAPAIPKEGVCNGFTSMWIQAVATGEEQELNFYNRLDALSDYLSNPNNTIETLKNEIKAVQDSQKSPTRKPLTESELNLIDVQAFAESIAIQQEPIKLNIFEEFIAQRYKPTLYPFTASATLEKSSSLLKIKSDLIGVVAATLPELEQYFNSIREMLIKKNKKVSFLLCSDNHAIGVYHNPQSGKWHFLDINRLSNKEKYYFSVDTSELAPLVFSSLFDENTPNTLFSITCISTQHDQTLVAPLKTITHELLPNSSTKVNGRGYNALLLAALYSDVASIKALLTAEANVEAVVKDNGFTALMLATQDGHIPSISALLAAGTNVEILNKDGFTALMIAAQNGHTSSVLALITAGANIKTINKDGFTALMIAKQNNRLSTEKSLINIEKYSPKGFPTLIFTAQNSAESSMIFNRVDKVGNSTLMLAAQNGDTDVVNFLIGQQANIYAQNQEGHTALTLAAQNGHLSAVKILVDAKKERAQGFGSLLFSAQNIADSISARYWRKIDVVDKKGNTALMLAAQNGHLEVVHFLITRQASIHLQNQQGHTSLMLAAQSGHANIIERLISHGAAVNTVNKFGRTALTQAKQNNHALAIKTLIKHGAIEPKSWGLWFTDLWSSDKRNRIENEQPSKKLRR